MRVFCLATEAESTILKEKKEKRARDIKTGRIVPQEVAQIVDGGKFQRKTMQMTRKEYAKVYSQNTFGSQIKQDLEQEQLNRANGKNSKSA